MGAFGVEPLRLLYLPHEYRPGDQRGRIGNFQSMLARGHLASLEVFSYRIIARECGWKAMWMHLLEAASRFGPTAIYWQHMVNGEIDEVALASLKKLPSRPVICSETGDAFGRFWVKPFSKTLLRFGQLSDVTFLSGLGRQKEYLNKRGVPNVYLLPHGFDELSFGKPFPVDYSPKYDVVMIVNRIRSRKPFGEMPGQRERRDLIRRLTAEFGDGFALYGNGWDDYSAAKGPVDFFQQEEAYRNSKVGIGGPNFLDIDYYESNRPFNAIGSGIPYVSRYSPGMERMLQDGVHCYYYHDNRQAVELVRKLVMQSNADRLTFGAVAADFVREHHSVERRMYTLIHTLENSRAAILAGKLMPPQMEDFFLDQLRLSPACMIA